VRFAPGAPPRLEIRALYLLENSGNSELAFIDVNFPEARAYGRQNTRAQWSGRDAAMAKSPEATQAPGFDRLRIAADSPWGQQQRRELLIAYDFVAPEAAAAQITLGEREFHLGSRGWSPALLPPKHFLTSAPQRPDKTLLTVRVPPDFRVLARGAPAGRKSSGNEIERRFLLRANDPAPFVVAGRYTPSAAKARAAVFWTLEPLSGDAASAAARITEAWSALETNFGALDKNIGNPHIVESPELPAERPGSEPAVAFPGGALVGQALLQKGAGSGDLVESVTHALAHDWFGDDFYFLPEAAMGMGEGLPEYAAIVVGEAQAGEPARRKSVAAYLAEYDEARKHAPEKPLARTSLTDPPEQRRIALAKAPLFYVALEDLCGERPVRNGIERLATLLRGQEAGYDDLRAALEMATGKDLAKPFHAWLYEKEIPAEFRARYQTGGAAPPQASSARISSSSRRAT